MQKTFTPKTEKLYAHGSIGPLILKDYLWPSRRTMAAGTVSVMIGWLVKKFLDALYASVAKLVARIVSKNWYSIVRTEYLVGLEYKAKCLSILKQAYDDLNHTENTVSRPKPEKVEWRQ